MPGRQRLRRNAIPIGLTLIGFATTPAPASRAEPVAQTLPASVNPLAPGCPYASLYVSVSTNGSQKDAEIGERVELAYAQTLGEQGFQLVAAPEEAYWSAFSLVSTSPRVDSIFAWSVYMTATQDLRGRVQSPVRFASASDEPKDLSGYMLLKEVRLLELDLEVRKAAERTALALLPHATRMCQVWTEDPHGDGGEGGFRHVRDSGDLLEELREELAAEIIRMRRERQRMTLDLDVEPPS